MKNNNAPALSVLVPCYNVEKYIEECLDSICAQTFQDYEVICLNDGSTDGTRALLESYAARDARFKVVNKENSGYGASMNRGLEEATGEYIAILESDDFMEPQALETLYGEAKANSAQVVKANFFFYWSTPEPRNEKNSLITAETPHVVNPAQYHQLFWYMPSIWSAIYQREFLNNNGIRFLETPGASYQDLAFTFKVWACAHTVVLLENAFVHYRQDNEASSIHAPGKVFCVCDEFEEMERFLAAHPEHAALKPVEARLKFDSYIWNFWRLDATLRKEFFPRFVSDFKKEEAAGSLCYDMFLPWAEVDLRQILADPDSYLAWVERTNGKQGKVAALVRYFKVGGFPLLMKRLKH